MPVLLKEPGLLVIRRKHVRMLAEKARRGCRSRFGPSDDEEVWKHGWRLIACGSHSVSLRHGLCGGGDCVKNRLDIAPECLDCEVA